MRKVCVQSPALILVLVLLAAVPAFSTVTTFDNRVAWESALLGRQDVTFTGFAGATALLNVGSAPDTVTFTPIGTVNMSYLSPAQQSWGIPCVGTCLWNWTTNPLVERGITAVFNHATTSALAFNLFSINNPGQEVTVRIYEGASVTPTYTSTVATSASTSSFIGLTSDTTITRIELVTSNSGVSNGEVVIDNFSWGEAISSPPPNPGGGGAETPESATLGYVGAGIIALALSTRRKRARLARRAR